MLEKQGLSKNNNREPLKNKDSRLCTSFVDNSGQHVDNLWKNGENP